MSHKNKIRNVVINLYHITFCNKAIELLNKPTIAVRTVVYNITNPICSVIFNFNSFVSSNDADKFIANSQIVFHLIEQDYLS